MDELRRPRTEAVHSEQRAVLGRDQQLQHAVRVTDDLPAGQLAVAGDTDLERHPLLGELVLGPAHEADLGDGVDADRLEVVHPADGLPEGVVRRRPPLLHRGRGQRRETDDVADGVDVRHLGAVVLVDRDPAARVRGQPGPVQVQLVGEPLPARRVHHRLGGDLLAALQDGQRAPGMLLDGGDRLPEAERHGEVPQVVLERLDHLDVAHVEHPGALLHHRDLAAERGEHRGVLHADDSGADDDHGARHPLQRQDVVRVHDRPPVELHTAGPRGPGAGGDHDVLGG